MSLIRPGTLALLTFLLTMTAGVPVALAQAGRSADDNRLREVTKKVETGKSVTVIAAQLSAALAGLALLSVAYTIGRKGLEVSKGKRLQGAPKWIVAAIVAAIGVGVGVDGGLYLPTMLGLR